MTSYALQHPYSSLRVDTLSGLRRDVFVETGSNVGRGIQVALDAGFREVYSVEAEEELFLLCQEKWSYNGRVHLFHGDSPVFLRDIVSKLSEQAVIYLDAHTIEHNPLLDELRALESGLRRDHILLIDDVRMFGTPDWHGLSGKQIKEGVLKINKHYRFSYRDTNHGPGDVLVAKVMM